MGFLTVFMCDALLCELVEIETGFLCNVYLVSKNHFCCWLLMCCVNFFPNLRCLFQNRKNIFTSGQKKCFLTLNYWLLSKLLKFFFCNRKSFRISINNKRGWGCAYTLIGFLLKSTILILITSQHSKSSCSFILKNLFC